MTPSPPRFRSSTRRWWWEGQERRARRRDARASPPGLFLQQLPDELVDLVQLLLGVALGGAGGAAFLVQDQGGGDAVGAELVADGGVGIDEDRERERLLFGEVEGGLLVLVGDVRDLQAG